MKKNISIFFLMLCFLNVNGQSTFFQSYGGNGNDYGESIISCTVWLDMAFHICPYLP